MGKFHTALIGDVGGTNARFALADLTAGEPRIANIRDYSSKAYKNGGDLVRAYLSDTAAAPEIATIAVAGPITRGAVHFTNLGWSFSESELTGLGFARAKLLNDFESLALATQYFKAGDLHSLGAPGEGEPNATVAVIGPGTGFGASALVRGDGRAIALAAEGGHATFAAGDDVEREIVRVLSRRYEHISIERVLSGPGIKNVHDALNTIEGVSSDAETPDEITRRAREGDPFCRRTIERFCAMLGSVAGDFALTYGARGGLFIAGGICPSILPILERSEFRRRFEAKGRFQTYLAGIPTHVILHSHAAFLGAAHLAQKLAQAD